MSLSAKSRLVPRSHCRKSTVKNAELNLLLDSKKAAPRGHIAENIGRFFRKYYKQNGRRFAWRIKRTSAFQLLMAEILLKQTKAGDVEPVWLGIIRGYPTPSALAKAPRPSLLRLLKPLGLQHQRFVALKSLAKAINEVFLGKVPKEIENILALPYVGLYSACAVACFCYGTRVPIVDANVLRVLSRLTGGDYGRDLRRNHDVWSLAWAILPRKRFAAHNYGLLDFSALLCKARSPECPRCPLRRKCVYGKSSVDSL
jgi:A/G-specific adenine glycosylase